MGRLRLFATVINGLEDVAASEVERLTGRPASVDVGKIFFEADEDAVFKLNFCSRVLSRVMILLYRGRMDPISLDSIYSAARSIDYTGLIDPDQSFAVRARRSGEHDFTSVDVASRVGGAVIDSYLRDAGRRLKVNLENPDVEFICIVRGDEFIMGLNTSGEPLHKRHYRVYNHPAALNTTIASAMLMLSGWDGREPLLDPMCGGGTIPVEAALMARRIPPGTFRRESFAFLRLRFLGPEGFRRIVEKHLSQASDEAFPIYGLDLNQRYIEGAIKNSEAAGVRDTITFRVGDALRLRGTIDFEPDYVVTNPPYGLRMRRGELRTFYGRFLESLREVAEGSVLTLITAARRKFTEAAEDKGLEVIWRKDILHGEIRATIFKCII